MQDNKTYQITQLKTYTELSLEGHHTGHCVGGYGYKCAKGYSSIWSLRILNNSCYAKIIL